MKETKEIFKSIMAKHSLELKRYTHPKVCSKNVILFVWYENSSEEN